MSNTIRALALVALAFAVSACASAPPVAIPPTPEEEARAAPVSTTRAPPPPVAIQLPPPEPVVTAPPRAPGDIVVPAPVRPIEPTAPEVDPRSAAERAADIRAWDQCVLAVQGRREPLGGANPVYDAPEDICRKRLGMSGRTALPDSRRP